ncbi:hypothetical protein BDZ85DRAFT_37735 [Elsinoe ampelina]|uniref:Nephrocystin 3-like N-terminal domain-containing protein n=1 Tax=Elsinoe ampelina TaxID=302913 RepID=A0A6A6G333_9PEZI|nr:hypothetical protein BDZ85DRAFT_37735 [Elsinoe ampelina]
MSFVAIAPFNIRAVRSPDFMSLKRPHSALDATYNNHGAVGNQVVRQTNHGPLCTGTVNNYYGPGHSSSWTDHGQEQQDQQPRDANIAEKRRLYMEALEYDSLDDRVQNVKPHLKTTCTWILDSLEYKSWTGSGHASSDQRLIWMKGKPASGKSTMMKYLYNQTAKHRKDCAMIPFFYNARGSALDQSPLGMWRTLLWKLLEREPGLQSILDDIRLPCDDSGGLQWKLEVVKDSLRAALGNSKEHGIIFFIDALDECKADEVKDMVDSFHDELLDDDNIEVPQLSIFFSSRHYPHLDVRAGTELVLEDQDEHRADIERYIQRRLVLRGRKGAADLRRSVLERSAGVFLWVVLVTKILNEEHDKGNIINLKQRLHDIPDDLEELFGQIMVQGVHTDARMVLSAQWVLFAWRPLSVSELYWAIKSGTDLGDVSHAALDNITEDDMQRFVLDSCKGLLERTPGRKKSSIQFIHETVREFFFKGGLDKHGFGEKTTFEGRSHDAIKTGCIEYLNFCDTRAGSEMPNLGAIDVADGEIGDDPPDEDNPLSTPRASPEHQSPPPRSIQTASAEGIKSRAKNPELAGYLTRYALLGYVLGFLYRHADAAQSKSVDQTDFLTNFDDSEWVRLNRQLKIFVGRRYTVDLARFAAWDLHSLFRLRLMMLGTIDLPESGRGPPEVFAAAIEAGNSDCLATILELGPSYAHHRTFSGTIRVLASCEKAKLVAVLVELKGRRSWAEAIAKAVLQVDSTSQKRPFNAGLIRGAAKHGLHETMSYLLALGYIGTNDRINIPRFGNMNALTWACENARHEIVDQLLARDDLRIISDGMSNLYTELRKRPLFEWSSILDKSVASAENAAQLLQIALQDDNPNHVVNVSARLEEWFAQGSLSAIHVLETCIRWGFHRPVKQLLRDDRVIKDLDNREVVSHLLRLESKTIGAAECLIDLLDVLAVGPLDLRQVVIDAELPFGIVACFRKDLKTRAIILKIVFDRFDIDANLNDRYGCSMLERALGHWQWECVRVLDSLPGLCSNLTVEEEHALCSTMSAVGADIRRPMLVRALAHSRKSDEVRATRNRVILLLLGGSGEEAQWHCPSLSYQERHLKDVASISPLLSSDYSVALAGKALRHFQRDGQDKLYLKEWAAPDISDEALILSIQKAETDCVKYLLAMEERWRCNINKHEKTGYVPLIGAVLSGSLAVLQLLLSQEDLNLDETDHYGHTALDVAIMKDAEDMAKLIEAESQRRQLAIVDTPML